MNNKFRFFVKHVKTYIVSIFFLVLSMNNLTTFAQIYHEDDKEGLRAFLRQPSAVEGEINAQRLGLTLTDTLNWTTSETWVENVIGIFWNTETPKRLTKICHSSANLAGNLDATKWTKLTWLECAGNQLTDLDVSANTELTYLYCGFNQLTALDVSANTALTYLSCRDNQLTDLDVSTNTALSDLWCDANQLTALDVSANTALTILSCYMNQLTALDVSANTELTHLSCNSNQLTDLVTANTKLTYLGCENNQLTALDVSANTALTSLSCRDNQLTDLDVSANTELTYLYCNMNQLTDLDVSTNTALSDLWCNANQLTALDVSANTALLYLDCSYNQLTALDLSANTELTYLWCFDNQLQLSDLYIASVILENNNVEMDYRRLGTQTLSPRYVILNVEVSNAPAQNHFGSYDTQYEVTQYGYPAPTSAYTVANGNITFHTLGAYTVTMTNEAIISYPYYPAEVSINYIVMNSDATLSNLTVSTGTLTPAFNSNTYNYTVDVEYSVTEITIIGTATDPNATVVGNGLKPLVVGENIFTITITAADGVTTLNYNVTVNRADDVGIIEIVTEKINIYPNPTTGELKIENGNGKDARSCVSTIKNIEVFDIYGRKLNLSTCPLVHSFTRSLTTTIDISHLQSGIYFVKITTETGVVVKKVVKE